MESKNIFDSTDANSNNNVFSIPSEDNSFNKDPVLKPAITMEDMAFFSPFKR